MFARLSSPRRALFTALAAAALLFVPPQGQARIGGLGSIVRIEQDWVLVVSTPDANRCSPQLFFQMYPESGGDYSCQFLVNYNDQPRFAAGGVQIQVWQNSTVLDGKDNNPNQSVLTADNETVTFTLVMEIKGGQLNFSAINVSSTSWGDVTKLAVNVPYDPDSFQNYKTSDTVKNSGILLGSNRVTSLTLNQVRLIDRSGFSMIELPQVIFP
jgi:hypothetical protein